MRRWRVGTLTMGLVLIGFGVLLLIGRIQGISTIDLIYKWWPIVLIMLGIETLVFVYSAKDGENRVRFDGFSIFLIIVLIIFTLGGYGIKLVFNNADFSFNHNNVFRNYKYETQLKKKISVTTDGLKKLQLTNSMGRIDVGKGTGADIEIEANITIQNNDEAFAKTLFDKAVEISKGSDIKINTTKYNRDDRIKNIYIDYVVKVPNGIEVDVDNSFGNISVREISSNVNIENSNGRTTAGLIGGNLTVKNSFGDIEVTGVEGNATINNSNGHIFVKNANKNVDVKNSFGGIEIQAAGGNVKAANSNGRIYIEDPFGDVYAHNSFGEIYVINPSKLIDLESNNGLVRLETSKLIENNVSIKNNFGGIKLDIPKTQTGKMKMSTSFGNIKSNMNLNINKETSKASVDQILGDEKVVFDVKTSNGNIDINGK